jgi:outer membrane protein OmpA-like peptidoglycan-associated protein
MSLIRTRCLMLVMGLCLAGAAIVAPPASANNPADNGQLHDSSLYISEAQGILQHAGYLAPGSYRKGDADDSTVMALQSFQTAHGLLPTGTIDYETTTQLLSHAGTVDSDGDGVSDDLDRCPGTPRGSWVDTHGCPEATNRTSLFEGKKSLVLEGVKFDTDTARLKFSSRVVLDRVAKSLNAWPDARVEVDGHTDSTNTDAYNLKLSRERSAAVSEYLVDRGVASSRLQEKGYGESRPIADNTTSVGRATNRRVELTRID